MGFSFTYICDLLGQLESNIVSKAASAAKRTDPDVPVVIRWFDRHQKQIFNGQTDLLALLSCIFPEKRPDRVYGLREPSLVRIIGRCLLLGASRRQDLDRWQERGGGDLGQCVQNVMQLAENDLRFVPGVTVEEIDVALSRIASSCRFSGQTIRQNYSAVDIDNTLAPIFRRLSSRDAKWLTRLILKDFSPVIVPEQLVLRTFHFLLPTLLTFQDSLEASLNLLSRDPIKSFPPRPSRDFADHLTRTIVPDLIPLRGVKIGRPGFYKARSLQNCCTMAGNRKMSIERKYDGEYCQIHIDLSKGRNCLQIFSKSGKDSTNDRQGVHTAVRECLKIGSPRCNFSDRCVLEGELLVWSDEKSDILPFDRLRRHIPRSGTFIGTENDSPLCPHEHLYLVFFDVLLIDDNVCLTKSYTERQRLLHQVVTPIEGHASLAVREGVDFSLPDGREQLKEVFATAIAQRWEGIILKACDEPYFTLKQHSPGDPSGHWIKFKKEYIPGLGDTADFLLVGARYDAREASNLHHVQPLLWTSFFVGCLENPGAVSTSCPRRFRVVDMIGRHNMHVQYLRILNQTGQFYACDPNSENSPFTLTSDQIQLPSVEIIFRKPFIVEMSGSGFGKPAGVRYSVLKFPRVLKIHSDRTPEDATTFEGLQQLARNVCSVPQDELSPEREFWATRLDPTDGVPNYITDWSQSSALSTISGNSNRSSAPNAHSAPRNGKDTSSVRHAQGLNADPSALQTGRKQGARVRGRIVSTTKTEPLRRCSSAATSPLEAVGSASPPKGPSHQRGRARYLAGTRNTPATRNQLNYSFRDTRNVVSSAVGQPIIEKDFMDEKRMGYRRNTPLARPSSMGPPFPTSAANWRCCQPVAVSLSPKRPMQPGNPGYSHSSYHSSSSTTPILLGPRLRHGKLRQVHSYLSKMGIPFTTSVDEFLDSLTATGVQYPRSRLPSSVASSQGIVIVDSHISQTNHIASDMARIGNALSSCLRTGGLNYSGKIVFLHWVVMHTGILEKKTDCIHKAVSNDHEMIGKRIFAGCLKWGRDAVARKRRREPPSRKVDNTLVERSGNVIEPNPRHTVAASWDWEEVLFLL